MLKTGLSYTLIGMGTVFVMLVFISFIIYLIGKTVGGTGKKAKEPAPAAPVKTEPVKVSAPDNGGISDEIIAVISAAIAAFNAGSAQSGDSYVVRGIRRR